MKASMRPSRWCPLLVASLLIGCEGGGMADLRGYVESVKTRPPAPIEPIPEIPAIETFVFDPAGRRDPFVMDTGARGQDIRQQLAPDPTRPKEMLEAFPLDSLRMVGTLQQHDLRLGLVRTQDGLIYQVKVGNYLGMNNGQIIEITDNEIRLTEIVSDLPGEWRERPAAISFTR